MHTLHKILVNISSIEGTYPDRKEVIRYAEAQTEEFYEQAFDWRECGTAGRWESEYPDNVLFARDDVDRFLNEILEAKQIQEEQINYCVKYLVEAAGSSNIEDIVLCDKHLTGYHLKRLGKLKDGEYFYDSCFYDTYNSSSLISEDLINEIREHPDDWALALFDYHF